MSRCLKCNYELVFLEERHKYKCAKCSSLFTEEEIRLAEFQKYRRAEREKEKEEAVKEARREYVNEYRKNNLKKMRSKARKYYHANKEKISEYCKKYRDENKKYQSPEEKSKRAEKSREYYHNNRNKILKQRKRNYDKNKENGAKKIRRNSDIESTRLNGRIEYWKRRQKVMAESRFNEFLEGRAFVKPKEILPTFVLA